MERMRTVEKDNFLEVLNKLVDLGKSKNNTLVKTSTFYA